VLPYDQNFYLVVEDPSPEVVEEVVRDLAMIGLDRVAGCFGAEVVQSWIDTSRAGQGVPAISPDELASLPNMEAVELIDVRNRSEWEQGRIPGSRNFALGRLTETLQHLPRDKPLVVHCQSGGRAAVVIGVMQANGFPDVSHLSGGFAEWRKQQRPVERGGRVPAAGPAPSHPVAAAGVIAT
jgi:hydroxyacylglutathione hydrolase